MRDDEGERCWRSECRRGCYYPALCSLHRWPVRDCCGERHGGVYCPVTRPNIGETCCGRCPGATCYVDQITGA